MDLSIIIPTYNRKDLIGYTLQSLDKKYHPGIVYEIIVVDDGSDDGTEDFIKKNYPAVMFLKNTGKGAAAARNTGLTAAAGKYISYLDSDDLVSENFYKPKIELLEKQNELDACYGEYEFFESHGAFSNEQIIFKHKYPIILSADSGSEHLINYLSGNFLPPNAIVWRKDFLRKCDGHDASLSVNQDVELFFKAIFNGMKIVGIKDGAKAYIRTHSLDTRVGETMKENAKLSDILRLRKKIYADMKAAGYKDEIYRQSLSMYLFGYWKSLRRRNPEMAERFLQFAREVYWPIQLKGRTFYKVLSKIFGPIRAVNIKYFLLRRD